ISVLGESELAQFFKEDGISKPHDHVIAGWAEHAQTGNIVLRRCHQRPRRRAAEQRDELAAPHSITSSARNRNDSGIVKPIAFAVLRLTTSSNFVGCSTGRSAGFETSRILCTRAALRLNMCGTSAPYDIRPPARGYDRSTAADGRRYLIAKSAMVLAKKTAWTTTACACLLAMAANAASTSLGSRTVA